MFIIILSLFELILHELKVNKFNKRHFDLRIFYLNYWE